MISAVSSVLRVFDPRFFGRHSGYQIGVVKAQVQRRTNDAMQPQRGKDNDYGIERVIPLMVLDSVSPCTSKRIMIRHSCKHAKLRNTLIRAESSPTAGHDPAKDKRQKHLMRARGSRK